MPKVRLETFDATVDVGMGQTLLDAALADGIDYPHSCRSGNCSACKSRLIDGEVDLMPYSEFALSDEERAAGYILACRCMVWEDSTVAVVGVEDEEPAATQVTARIVTLDDATHDIKRVCLEAESGMLPAFKPGQFANLSFGGLPGRDYSMASQPDDPVWEFHIRRMPDGLTSTLVSERARVGDTVIVKGPMGDAHLRTDHTGPILAIAGGSGLAPVKSIVEAALRNDPSRRVDLYFGVRDERDLYLTEHFQSLQAAHANMRFSPVLSEPAQSTGCRTGFVHRAALADLPDLQGFKVYMAGPPVMVEAANAALKERGVLAADIHADAFYPAEEMDRARNAISLAEAAHG